MNVLLQTAGQDAPPTGGDRKQWGMSQNGKLNAPNATNSIH